MDWYYADAGRQAGPVDDAALSRLAAAGTIRPDTLVWRSGMPNWVPYSSVQPQPQSAPAPVFAAPVAVGASSFCSECGRPYPIQEMVAFGNRLVCASCKPAFTQKMREGVLPGTRMEYGGFWIRFGAVMIDSIILIAVSMVFSLVLMPLAGVQANNPGLFFQTQGILAILNLLVGISYETFFIGNMGATPGKKVCRLKVVRPDGSPLTYARAAGRYAAKFLSSLTLTIGFIIAAFDDEKRSLHDRIADTRVIRS